MIPLLLEIPHDTEEVLHLGRGERRRRLVKEQNLRLTGDRLCDLHQLLLRNAQIPDDVVAVEVRRHLAENFVRVGMHLFPVHQSQRGFRQTADIDVGRHIQMREQIQLLMDHADAEIKRLFRRFDPLEDLVSDGDRSPIRLIDAGQHLDQRGLSRAVFPHERVDFLGFQRKIHILQCFHSGEGFHDSLCLKNVHSPQLLTINCS